MEFSEIKYLSDNFVCGECLGSEFMKEVKGISECKRCNNTGFVKTILDGILIS